MNKGYFFTIEGCEGCGKGEQLRYLFYYLTNKGYSVVKTREPGGTEIGKEIRNLVQNPKYTGKIDDWTEFLLFMSDRANHVNKLIIPELEKGNIVISDRYYDSTVAYQQFGRGLNENIVKALSALSNEFLKPDLTFYIDIDPRKGLEKTVTSEFRRKDRFESEDIIFHEKVREGYLWIAKNEPERVKTIIYIENGIIEMQNEIRKYVDELLEKQNGKI